MLIYGNRATKTSHQSLFGVKCSHCNTKDELEMYTFSRYFHLFWVPIFPYKKEATTQCNHCKQILYKKDFSSALLVKYEEIKQDVKTPFWQFIGIVLFGFLIVMGVYTAKQDDKKDISYLQAPVSGDVYRIRINTGMYTLYKVAVVQTDSVQVLVNQYQTNKLSGLRKPEMVSAESYIEDEYLPIAKSDLLKMKASGEIQAVTRACN